MGISASLHPSVARSLTSRFLLLGLLALGCSGTRTISFMAYQPPDFDVSLIKTVGVLRIDASDRQTGKAVETRLIQDLMRHGFFSVKEANQNLTSMTTQNQEQWLQIGRQLGVDAIIIGNVDGQISDNHSTRTNTKRVLTRYKTVVEYESRRVQKTVKVRVKEKGKWVTKNKKITEVKRVPVRKKVPIYEQVTYTEKYLERGGTITVNLRFIDVATGNILASRSASRQASHRKLVSSNEPPSSRVRRQSNEDSFGGFLDALIETVAHASSSGRRSSANIPDRRTIASDLAVAATRELSEQISPRQISAVRMLQSNKAVDRGVKYARNNQWDQAGREWRRIRDLHPEDRAAWNNLGVYYEHAGKYAEAKNAYDQAVAGSSDNRIARQNLSALRAMIEALQKQTASLGAKIEETSLGLMASSVLEGTMAERLGLRKGDIISRINRKPVDDLETLEKEVVKTVRFGGDLILDVMRAGEPVALSLVVGEDRQQVVSVPHGYEEQPTENKMVPVVDVDQVVKSSIRRPDALGVIFGVEDYRYAPSVPYARHDALVVHEYFVRALGLKESNIYIRTDRDATQGEFHKVFDPVQGWLAKRIKPGKTEVFIYFVGHGMPDPATHDAYLVPADGDPNYPATSFRLDELYHSMNRLPAGQITMIIDACFSGQVGRGDRIQMVLAGARGIAVEARRVTPAPHLVVLTAAHGNQVSSSYPEKSHGLFTYFILKGLQGYADQDGDSAVTVGELYAYVRESVVVQAGYLDREQTPELHGVDFDRILVKY